MRIRCTLAQLLLGLEDLRTRPGGPPIHWDHLTSLTPAERQTVEGRTRVRGGAEPRTLDPGTVVRSEPCIFTCFINWIPSDRPP